MACKLSLLLRVVRCMRMHSLLLPDACGLTQCRRTAQVSEPTAKYRLLPVLRTFS